MSDLDAITTCDRSDHDHGSLEEARQCWQRENVGPRGAEAKAVIQRFTYRDIIRRYGDLVASGHSDTDLTPRQRRLVQTMLNLASNAGPTSCLYPPTDQTRDETAKNLGNILWDARPLAEAASPRSSDDIGKAHERAIAIIRGV